MKKSLLLLIALFISGCATTGGWHWQKFAATENDFKMESAQCRAQGLAGTGGIATPGAVAIMNSCLEGKGWSQVQNQ